MKSKTLILFIFIILVNMMIAESIFDPRLYYTDKNIGIYDIEEDDFEGYINALEDKSASKDIQVSLEDFKVKLTFKDEIEVSDLKVKINGIIFEKKDRRLDAEIYSEEELYWILFIGDMIKRGKNILELTYESSENEEGISWEFNISENLIKKVKILKGTDDGSAKEKDMAFQPGSHNLCYISQGDPTVIYIHNLENGKRTKVTTQIDSDSDSPWEDEEVFASPTWSNNGRYLYYIQIIGEERQILRAEVDGNGEIQSKNIKSLTNFQGANAITISAISHSPVDDNLVYACRKLDSDEREIRWVTDLENVKNEKDFIRNSETIYTIENSILELDYSYDGKLLAINERNNSGGDSIVIYQFDKNRIVDTITNNTDQYDNLEWSPKRNLMTFCLKGDIYLYNFDEEKSCKIAGDQRYESLLSQPAWNSYGTEIYYISSDGGNPINRIQLSDEGEYLSTDIYIDSSRYPNRYLLETDDQDMYIVFLSYQNSYALNYVKIGSENAVTGRFAIPENIDISYKLSNNDLEKDWNLLCYQPEVNGNNVWVEKDSLKKGKNTFKFSNKEQTVTIASGNSEIFNDKNLHKTFNKWSRLPYIGQGIQNRTKLKKAQYIFTLSSLAAFGTGLYFVDSYYTVYDDPNISSRDLFLNKSQGYFWKGYSEVQNEVIGYAFLQALVDANYIKCLPSEKNKKRHEENWNYQSENKKNNTIINGIKKVGCGQLKINCFECNTKIFYRIQDSDEKWTYAGKSNYIMDPDTYFTITDLRADRRYELKFSKTHSKSEEMSRIDVREYKNTYVYHKFGSNKNRILSLVPSVLVPGYEQLKRGQYLKSLTYFAVSGYSGYSVWQYRQKAKTKYNDYGEASTQAESLNCRTATCEYDGKQAGYIIMFSLNYFSNLLDVLMNDMR